MYYVGFLSSRVIQYRGTWFFWIINCLNDRYDIFGKFYWNKQLKQHRRPKFEEFFKSSPIAFERVGKNIPRLQTILQRISRKFVWPLRRSRGVTIIVTFFKLKNVWYVHKFDRMTMLSKCCVCKAIVPIKTSSRN